MSHCCFSCVEIRNQLGYEHYSNCSAHCTRMSTLPHIRLEFADENKEPTVVWQLLLTWFRRQELLLVTKINCTELFRHTRARIAARVCKYNFRHEVIPFATIRIGIRSATRLWSMI